MGGHRATLKQVNKGFKGSKATKDKGRLLLSANGTRPVVTVIPPGGQKGRRVNAAKQMRENRQKAARQRQAGLTTEGSTGNPRVVVILPFHANAHGLEVKRQLVSLLNKGSTQQGGMEVEVKDDGVGVEPHRPIAVQLPNWAKPPHVKGQQKLLFVDPPVWREDEKEAMDIDGGEALSNALKRDTLESVLDAVKVADVLLCVFNTGSFESPAFDSLGYRLLSAIRMQGLPLPVGVIVDGEGLQKPSKSAVESRKLVKRFFQSEFGTERRIFTLPCKGEEDISSSSTQQLIRHLAGSASRDFAWREGRGFMLTQKAEFNHSTRQLAVAGYVKGVGFSVQYPVHLTGVGDFIVSKIVRLPEDGEPEAVEVATDDVKTELKSITRLAPFDPFASEQTFPTEEELAEAEASMQVVKKSRMKKVRVPAGTSDYQAAWLAEAFDDDDEEERTTGLEKIEEEEEEEEVPMLELDDDGDTEPWTSSRGLEGEEERRQLEADDAELPRENAEDLMLQQINARRKVVELEMRSSDDMQFPDEVDTPCDVPARERFQRYRGIKSFRTSPWNPYEDPPDCYSRIHDFDNHRANGIVARRIRATEHRCEQTVGTFCSLVLDEVDEGTAEVVATRLQKGMPLVTSLVYPEELKVSVVNLKLSRHDESQDPLPSKEVVQMHCGFRRFPCRPIYTQYAVGEKRTEKSERDAERNTAKTKYERFFHKNATVIASFYGPALFSPCPALMFIDAEADRSSTSSSTTVPLNQQPRMLRLAAWGGLHSVDPWRVVVRRVVLTGYPFKVHKSKAVVRYMFFSPEDVRWFRPVELYTKKGLRGHILEPLGTHGYMKCAFNDRVDQSDTVCLALYKRVFPKWFPPTWGGKEECNPRDHP